MATRDLLAQAFVAADGATWRGMGFERVTTAGTGWFDFVLIERTFDEAELIIHATVGEDTTPDIVTVQVFPNALLGGFTVRVYDDSGEPYGANFYVSV